MSDPSIVEFGDATVGQMAYTWEHADNGTFGDYRFETAGDPRELWSDEGEPIVRKLWQLVEVVELPDLPPKPQPACDCDVVGAGRTYEVAEGGALVGVTIPCPHVAPGAA